MTIFKSETDPKIKRIFGISRPDGTDINGLNGPPVAENANNPSPVAPSVENNNPPNCFTFSPRDISSLSKILAANAPVSNVPNIGTPLPTMPAILA